MKNGIETLYTKEEAAQLLHCTAKTLYKWICQRRIAVIKGGCILISESAIKEFIRKRTKRARV